ncbi:hypothetical protein [Conchiformibius steedae]|uniref:hypothetical protein n=1 Tax=Conchiformibius steedae TaxID=153493 RepID=UPI0015F566C7|nr:hypothetical protein [Conchiformibius steedae]QMT34450.1 hypothetical protein H3L98_05680 [Conchiformibius steedae]
MPFAVSVFRNGHPFARTSLHGQNRNPSLNFLGADGILIRSAQPLAPVPLNCFFIPGRLTPHGKESLLTVNKNNKTTAVLFFGAHSAIFFSSLFACLFACRAAGAKS